METYTWPNSRDVTPTPAGAAAEPPIFAGGSMGRLTWKNSLPPSADVL